MSPITVSRRNFLFSTAALAASTPFLGPSELSPSIPVLAQKTKGILPAIRMAALKLHYDFELDSIALTYRVNFSAYFPLKDLSLLDLNAFDTASDMLPLENLLPGFITYDNNGDFANAMEFFNPGYGKGLPPEEIAEIESHHIKLLTEILESQKRNGEKTPIRGAKYIYEKTGEGLLRILVERDTLTEMTASSRTPQFAGKEILHRAFTKGPEFLQGNFWFKLNKRKELLEQRLGQLKKSEPGSLEHRRTQEELNDTNTAINRMNGASQPKNISKNKCTSLSVISPKRNLSLNIEEKCKGENIELVFIKKEDGIIGFIYSNSKGIIEFVKPELLKEINWKGNDDRIIFSFEKGSNIRAIENKVEDLYC